ncbi:MAG TPA: hypothetical protein VFF26_01445 [Gallionella sp.]|nr:hypothetical protein [Gallionella sp.]
MMNHHLTEDALRECEGAPLVAISPHDDLHDAKLGRLIPDRLLSFTVHALHMEQP